MLQHIIGIVSSNINFRTVLNPHTKCTSSLYIIPLIHVLDVDKPDTEKCLVCSPV